MHSEFRLLTPPPARVRHLRSRNGFGEWQCDNDTGTWEDLELWSQLHDSFREMKRKLFGEYFSSDMMKSQRWECMDSASLLPSPPLPQLPERRKKKLPLSI